MTVFTKGYKPGKENFFRAPSQPRSQRLTTQVFVRGISPENKGFGEFTYSNTGNFCGGILDLPGLNFGEEFDRWDGGILE